MKKFRFFTIIFLLFLCLFNLYSSLFRPNQGLSYQLQMSALSSGDRYYGRLSLWYYYAKKGDWVNAHLLESQLDPADLIAYKNTHDPSQLKKYLNSLLIKSGKTVEDWLEIAQIQNLLGKKSEAVDSVGKARTLDPIRDDISRIYYQIGR